MNCQDCADNLTAYMDGELSAADGQEMESHLVACAGCEAESRSLKEAALFLESRAREIELGPSLWANVRARIAMQPTPARSLGFLQLFYGNRLATAAAALAATLILTLGVWSYFRDQQSEYALESYMMQYLEERESQEQIHHSAGTPAIHSRHEEFSHNPFVVETVDVSFTNPFRVEGK